MDYPLSGLLVISWSVVSSIHFFLAIGIDALSQIRWMNHQRPFQSQSFDKTGEHNSPKLYPFVSERASISRHKNRLQDQDHSWTLILLASLKSFSILCARAFATVAYISIVTPLTPTKNNSYIHFCINFRHSFCII